MSTPPSKNGHDTAQRLRDIEPGHPALCLRVSYSPGPEIAYIAKAAGFDALYVDLEHSTIALDQTARICAAATAIGLPSLVRVRHRGDVDMERHLDFGAAGIIAPHVENAEQAEEVVRRCNLPPRGSRSVGGRTIMADLAAILGAPGGVVIADPFVAVMIESQAGLDEAAAIASVPGVDLLLVGTADLATELGVPGQYRHELIQAAYRTVVSACEATARFGIAGILDPRDAEPYRALGATFLTAGSDGDLLRTAAVARTRELRGAGIDAHDEPEEKVTY